MDNLMGFIVSVRTKGSEPVEYEHAGYTRKLEPGEEFIGYYACHTNVAQIQEVKLVDQEKMLFLFGEHAAFREQEVSISIRALRGNVSYVGVDVEGIESWFSLNGR